MSEEIKPDAVPAVDDVVLLPVRPNGQHECSPHEWMSIEPYGIQCEKCGRQEVVKKGKPTPDHYFM